MRVLADLTGNKLVEFPMNSDADTTELLGGFEQVLFLSHHYMYMHSNLTAICSEHCCSLLLLLVLW